MPDAPTPLDLNAIRDDLDARVPARDLEDRSHARALIHEVERLRARVSDEPGECVMTHTPPFDFAQCETHDETFPLGGACRFHGRTSVAEVYADEADQMRARAVLAEAEVARLTARPAPAWDEEVVVERAFTAAANAAANDETWAKASDHTKAWWRMIVQAVARPEPNDGPGPDGRHVISGECFACLVGVATGPESHADDCPCSTPTPAWDEEAVQAEVLGIDARHHFHGTACLCGFDSHGRARSATEHITSAVLAVVREHLQ